MINASHLYDYHQCPHRVYRDLHDDPSEKDDVNAFIKLLWEKGTKYEEEVIAGLRVDHTNLKSLSGDEKFHATIEAMKRGEPLIYGGRIVFEDLVGEPDLLKKVGNDYIPGDIKSGAGLEGDDDSDEGKPKPHYALQLALYSDILVKLGFSTSKKGFVWDIKGKEVPYELSEAKHSKTKETWWDLYLSVLQDVRNIQDKSLVTEPGYSSGTCKLCYWYSSCKTKLTDKDDLTLLPSLGAATKRKMVEYFSTTLDLANADLPKYHKGSTTIISGVGKDSLDKFQKRAQLKQSGGAPYALNAIPIPRGEIEVFYDIEVDPMRDFCYLHGLVERLPNGTERFHGFMVNDTSSAEEERIFRETVEYFRHIQNWVMFYYSPYERTWWKKLQVRYPHIITPEEVDEIFKPEFNRSMDLYHGLTNKMIWPTIDHSVKTLARYFGFDWRDTHPSGAASVEWFDTWVNSGKEEDRQRILDYNEDDCIAMRVVLVGIRNLF